MEYRAKQRLTGAVILVALVVLLVPELLTGPSTSRPAAEATNDEGMRRYTIDLDAPDGAGRPIQQAPPEDGAVNLPAPGQPLSPQSSLATPGEAAAPLSEDRPKPRPTPSVAQAKPEAATPAPRGEAVRSAGARAESELPAPPPALEPGSFVVQLGSFSSRENADRLAGEMTAKGFRAFIAPITSNGRELYRVRVGPARDRASAEALAAQLKRVGQTGSSIVPIS